MKLKLFLLMCAAGASLPILGYNNPYLRYTNSDNADTTRYLAYKIGNTVDDILKSTASCCAADYLIYQCNIPYVITHPGIYFLAESVTIEEGAAITIASDNVVLNLNDKMIEGIGGQSAHERAIEATAVNNVTIKNGRIKNCGSGIRLADTANILEQVFTATIRQQNITIDGVDIWINKNNLCPLPEGVTGIIIVNGLDTRVSNCNVYVDSNNFACDDGPFSNSIHGIVLTGSQLLIDECTVSGARNNFAFIGSQVVCKDCSSFTNPDLMLTGTITTGFTTAQMDSAYFYNCYAAGAVVNFNFYNTTNVCARDCVAFGGMIGYQANYNGMFFDCVASNHVENGFSVNPQNSLISSVLTRCQSLNNGGSGFHVGAASILRDCVALHNGYDGIYVEGDNVELRDCSAAHNSNVGIDLNASGLVVCNNTVHNNTNGDYHNVVDSDTCHKLDDIYALLLTMTGCCV